MGVNPAPGVDVSGNNGAISWDAVAASGYEFAVIKATEGATFRDPYFSMNWSGAKLAGLVRGAYAFCRADLGTSPEGEAEWFLSVAGPALEAGDFLALDVEDPPGHSQPADLYEWVLTWVAYVVGRVGFPPLLYSTSGFLATHNLTGKADLAECGLWIASWYTTPPANFPKPPSAWPVTALWQHSATGKVPGVAGDCDLDLFNGTVAQLRLYGKPAPPPVDRTPLDLWYAAWQSAREAFDSPADLSDWDTMIPALDRIKTRNGIG